MNLTCTAPNEIEDADLLAYLAGEAEPAIVAHIESCAFCQQEVEAFARTDLLLTDAAHRQNCPDSDLLWQYVSASLTEAMQAEIKAHVDTCSFCQAEVVQLKTAVYHQPSSAGEAEKSTLLDQIKQSGKRFIAAVLQPPPPQPALAVRGLDKETLTFMADGYQITIKKVPPLAGSASWEIEGQLINLGDPLQEYVGEVRLQRQDETVAATTLNELGYFLLTAVIQGAYTIHIELDMEQLSIPEITIP